MEGVAEVMTALTDAVIVVVLRGSKSRERSFLDYPSVEREKDETTRDETIKYFDKLVVKSHRSIAYV